MGVHCPHVMAMATPSEALTVTMMNQTDVLIHPGEMRNTVRAKEVLLHSAARMEKVPERFEKRRNMSRFLELKSRSGRPKPKLIEAEIKAQLMTRAS